MALSKALRLLSDAKSGSPKTAIRDEARQGREIAYREVEEEKAGDGYFPDIGTRARA